MKTERPSMNDQLRFVFEQSTNHSIKQLKKNLDAPVIDGQTEIDESLYSRAHLQDEGRYEPPHPDIVGAYFRHFQATFSDYDTDKKLAYLLGLSSDRRVREFKQGVRKVPFGVWRKFLVITGRAPQEIIPVMAFVSTS